MAEVYTALISCIDTVLWKLDFQEKKRGYNDIDVCIVQYEAKGRTFYIRYTMVWDVKGTKLYKLGFANNDETIDSPWELELCDFGASLTCITGNTQLQVSPVEWFWHLVEFLSGSRNPSFQYLADEIERGSKPSPHAVDNKNTPDDKDEQSNSPPPYIGWAMEHGKRVWKSPALSCIDKLEYTRSELNSLFSADDLIAYCKLKDLPVGGGKKTLVQRILDYRRTGRLPSRKKKGTRH